MREPVRKSSEALSSNTGLDLRYTQLLRIYHYTFKTPEQAKDIATQITVACQLDNNPHLELGLNELFLNAIEHGNLGVSQEEKALLKNTADWHKLICKKLNDPQNLGKSVNVTIEIMPSRILFEITDQGKGFDWRNQNFQQPSPHKQHGRGLLLASELCFDGIEFLGNGNTVRCICLRN